MTNVSHASGPVRTQRPASAAEPAASKPAKAPFRASPDIWLKPTLISGGITAALSGAMLLQGAEEFASAGTSLGLSKGAIALGVLGPAFVVGGVASWIAIANARSRHERAG